MSEHGDNQRGSDSSPQPAPGLDASQVPAAMAQQLQSFVENIDELIYFHSLDGSMSLLNRAYERITGYSPEEYHQDPFLWKKIIHPDDIKEGEHFFAELAGTIESYETEYRLQRKDGQWRWIHSRMFAARDAEGRIIGYNCIDRDVTEQKQLQEQFVQAQKMEAIGRLAGGVAHDIRNQLTVISGYCDLLLRDGGLDDDVIDALQQVRGAVKRATGTTGQLLAFSRKQVLKPELLELGQVLTDMVGPLSKMIGEDVRVELNRESDRIWVEVDRALLEQAVMNLALNARDAMPEGGRLMLTAERTRTSTLPGSGAVASLRVRDEGCGMDEKTRKQIFEPFFTTKDVGKGTGLGLSMVYGFVKQSGGEVEVHSSLGEGAEFVIYLPVAPSLDQVDASPNANGETDRGNETVLVVEDEEVVRQLICRLLGRKGYSVLEAPNGAEAEAAAAEHEGPIHLLLTDVVMPVLGGPELAKRLQQSRPDTKVLFITGYAESLPDSGRGPRVLVKPFEPKALLVAVREVLDGVA